MATDTKSNKIPRAMKSFEAEPDVAAMLERAITTDGKRLVWLCNQALRKHLTDQGYSRKRDPIVK